MSDNKIEFIESRYAAFIAGLIESSPMSQAQIAKTIGYKNANNLSLIKSGKIPLPIDKFVRWRWHWALSQVVL